MDITNIVIIVVSIIVILGLLIYIIHKIRKNNSSNNSSGGNNPTVTPGPTDAPPNCSGCPSNNTTVCDSSCDNYAACDCTDPTNLIDCPNTKICPLSPQTCMGCTQSGDSNCADFRCPTAPPATPAPLTGQIPIKTITINSIGTSLYQVVLTVDPTVNQNQYVQIGILNQFVLPSNHLSDSNSFFESDVIRYYTDYSVYSCKGPWLADRFIMCNGTVTITFGYYSIVKGLPPFNDPKTWILYNDPTPCGPAFPGVCNTPTSPSNPTTSSS